MAMLCASPSQWCIVCLTVYCIRCYCKCALCVCCSPDECPCSAVVDDDCARCGASAAQRSSHRSLPLHCNTATNTHTSHLPSPRTFVYHQSTSNNCHPSYSRRSTRPRRPFEPSNSACFPRRRCTRAAALVVLVMFSFAAKKVLSGATDKLKDKQANDQAGGVNWYDNNTQTMTKTERRGRRVRLLAAGPGARRGMQSCTANSSQGWRAEGTQRERARAATMWHRPPRHGAQPRRSSPIAIQPGLSSLHAGGSARNLSRARICQLDSFIVTSSSLTPTHSHRPCVSVSHMFFAPVDARQEFNYPPCLTVVHFDPMNDAIPVLARDTVLRMRLLWYTMMGILFFNGR